MFVRRSGNLNVCVGLELAMFIWLVLRSFVRRIVKNYEDDLTYMAK